MSDHKGHRNRMRERFLNNGLDGYAEHEALEMLLYYCVPRMDTNLLAHRLIDEFGSLPQVFEATVADLMRVEGIGKSVAIAINFFASFCRYYYVKCTQQENVMLRSPEDFGKYLTPHFLNRRNEVVFAVCLDGKANVISCKMISEGSLNAAGVSIRRVVEVALASNSAAIVLAHNHPGGLSIPSGEDIQTTLMLAKALQTVDVELVDHIVFSNTNFTSMRETGYYDIRDVY